MIGNFSQSANGAGNGGAGGESTRSVTLLEPTPEFKAFFLNPSLVTILFKCYELARDDPDMAHICMQPLIQLSTLNGVIFKEDTATTADNNVTNYRLEFISNFLRSFVETFNRLENYDFIYSLNF